jgi:hypothetical protein
MKKPNTIKKGPAQKTDKGKETGELRKPAKLKPLKEKEKQSWKNSLEDEDADDFPVGDDDVKFDSFDDDDDDDGFYDDDRF